MNQTAASVIIFVLALAALPFCLKWIQRRSNGGSAAPGVASRVISALAVGPHQRVVTIEVGAGQDRVFLVLGVTAQHIHCLHRYGPGHDTSLPQNVSGSTQSSL